MRRLFVAIAIFGLACGSANAQDWSGVYFGGHLGGTFGSSSYDHVEAGPTPENALAPAIAVSSLRQSFSNDFGDVSGGLQAGVQRQFGNFVAGVEISYSFQELSDTVFTNLNGLPRNRTTEIGNMWTVAGRLGYASGPMLGYVKAGYASTDVGFRNVLNSTGALLGESNETVGGWLLGGGIEYLICDGVSVGLDYSYIHLNVDDQQQYLNGAPVAGLNDRINAELHQVTVRANYRFNWN